MSLDPDQVVYTLYTYLKSTGKFILAVNELFTLVKHLVSSEEELKRLLRYLTQLGLIELKGEHVILRAVDSMEKVSIFVKKTSFKEGKLNVVRLLNIKG